MYYLNLNSFLNFNKFVIKISLKLKLNLNLDNKYINY